MAGLEDPEASPGLFDSESEFEGFGSLQPSPTHIKQKSPHAPITSNDIGAVDTETTAGELLQALQADVVMEDAPLPSDQPNSGGLMQENVDHAQKGRDEDDDGDEDGDDYTHEQSGSEDQSEVGRRIGENSSRSSSSIVGKANSSGYCDSLGTSTSGNHERLQILIPSFTGFKDGEYHVAPPSQYVKAVNKDLGVGLFKIEYDDGRTENVSDMLPLGLLVCLQFVFQTYASINWKRGRLNLTYHSFYHLPFITYLLLCFKFPTTTSSTIFIRFFTPRLADFRLALFKLVFLVSHLTYLLFPLPGAWPLALPYTQLSFTFRTCRNSNSTFPITNNLKGVLSRTLQS